MDKDDKENSLVIRAEEYDVVKLIGLCWKPVQDKFIFHVVPIPKRRKVTMRILLFDLNNIFDPLGFLKSVVIKEKIFLSNCGRLKWSGTSL